MHGLMEFNDYIAYVNYPTSKFRHTSWDQIFPVSPQNSGRIQSPVTGMPHDVARFSPQLCFCYLHHVSTALSTTENAQASLTPAMIIRVLPRVESYTSDDNSPGSFGWKRSNYFLVKSNCGSKARFPLPELTARVNGPSWRVTGFHYQSTRAVLTGARFH